MAGVTGPVSTLPGAVFQSPDGMMCDEHSDRTAVKRVQGETDSFGCEMYDYCQECFDEYKQSLKEFNQKASPCDWCKKEATDLRPRRDYEEGSDGPVYYICGGCDKKYQDELRREAEEYGDDYH